MPKQDRFDGSGEKGEKMRNACSKNEFICRLSTPILDAADNFLFHTIEPSCGKTILRDWCDNKRYMFAVMIALFPITAASIYFYGWRVLAMLITSYITGVGIEWIFAAVRRHPINEGAFVTCLIYPLILPPTLPLWMVALGIAFGTFFGKEVFGGTGHNIFNPAMVGRVFLTVSFGFAMSACWIWPQVQWPGALLSYKIDALSCATPLTAFARTHEVAPYLDLFTGGIAGSIGETCKILIIPCGIFLMLTKVANWRTVFSVLLSAFVTAWIGHEMMPQKFAPPLFHMISGGLLFGAFFMATDPVTSAHTQVGKYIFGTIIGVLTVLIRALTGYVEGFMFALLFANAFAPLIDHMVLKLRYNKDFIS